MPAGFASFAMRFGMSNLAANAAAAMEQTVFGASYSSDDEYAGALWLFFGPKGRKFAANDSLTCVLLLSRQVPPPHLLPPTSLD